MTTRKQNNSSGEFINKVVSWLNRYYFIVSDNSIPTVDQPLVRAHESMVALRDFEANIWPKANKKAKNDHYANVIENAMNLIRVDPESYVHSFLTFYYLILHSIEKWID